MAKNEPLDRFAELKTRSPRPSETAEWFEF